MFWVASAMELFERWAWYGLFAVLALYLTGSTDEGGLGFTHTEKGQIMGYVTAILYLLPLFTGVIADKIGYKLSLIIAYLMLMSGYYLMGEVSSYTGVFMLFLYIAIGAAMFKPVASAIVTKTTNSKNSTLGFGIFYMMVNIGGFIGPALASGLRETGWNLVFLQASIVIGINLLIVIFFFKEPNREKNDKGFAETVTESLRNIFQAISDKKLMVLLIIMIGFWTMFNQLFYTLPTFIEDWVDSSSVSQAISDFWPWLGNVVSGPDGQIKPEWFTNIDAGMIVLLQIIVSSFVVKMRHVTAMIRGFLIAILGISLTFYFDNVIFTIVGVMIFAIGEMATNPTFSSFIAIISPKGKEALYQGTYFLPIFAGNLLTTFVSGNLYQAWSDKLSLIQNHMSNKGIDMPEVAENFSKNEYFTLASEKLGITESQMTTMLWEDYSPNKIWSVIAGIGLVTVLALYIYDLKVVKPREKDDQTKA